MVNPIEREIAVYDLEKTRYFKMYKECAPKERCFKYRFRWVHEYSNYQEYMLEIYDVEISYEKAFELLEKLVKLECKEGYSEIEETIENYFKEVHRNGKDL